MRDTRSRWYLGVFAVATVVFGGLAAAVLTWERVDRLDVRFVRWVHGEAPGWLVEALRLLTHLGSGVVLVPLAIAGALLLARRAGPGAAVFVLAACGGSQLLDQALKSAFRRARPELEDPFAQLTTYAFPSGHAFGATATYGALALAFASLARPGRRRILILGGAGVVIGLIATSRVILGVHYLLDVVAGIVAGVAYLSALLLALQRVRRPGFRLVLFPPSLGGHEQAQRAGLHAEPDG
jgi:membrane-associated phospholipid phosphatase